jgi:hypothetical protein
MGVLSQKLIENEFLDQKNLISDFSTTTVAGI